MAKRLITTLLGAALLLALGANAAFASADLTTPGEVAKAKAKAAAQQLKKFDSKASKAGAKSNTTTPTEEPTPECKDGASAEVRAARLKHGKDVDKLILEDETLLGFDDLLLHPETGAQKAYFDALDSAESAAEINAAFEVYKAAIEKWNADTKARVAELKPEIAALVEAHLEALAAIPACEDVIKNDTDILDGGQFWVTFWQDLADIFAFEGVEGEDGFPSYLQEAEDARDEELKRLESPVNPGPNPSLPTTTTTPGPSLPETGASAVPMLLGGLALITGGSTALLVARRRRATD
jgi:LPXTG-motif cell wall-anchored protein